MTANGEPANPPVGKDYPARSAQATHDAVLKRDRIFAGIALAASMALAAYLLLAEIFG